MKKIFNANARRKTAVLIIIMVSMLNITCQAVQPIQPTAQITKQDTKPPEVNRPSTMPATQKQFLPTPSVFDTVLPTEEFHSLSEMVLPVSPDSFGADVRDIAWQPDGRGLVVLYREEFPGKEAYSISKVIDHLVKTNLSTGQINILREEDQGYIQCIDMSPDGSRLAYTHGYTVYVLDWKSGQQKPILEGKAPGGETRNIVWSPDGTKLALGQRMAVTIIDSQTGDINSSYTLNEGQTLYYLQWNPDGSALAVSDRQYYLWIIDPDKQSSRRFAIGTKYTGFAYSPDGKYLALAKSLGSSFAGSILEIWDREMDNMIWSASPVANGNIAWSPDGKMIAVGSSSLPEYSLYVTYTTQTPLPKVSLPPTEQVPAGAMIYDFESGKAIKNISNLLYFNNLAWSPDGRWLAGRSFNKIGDIAEVVISVLEIPGQ